LKEIIDNTHDIIYRTDGKGNIQYLSDSVTKNLGFDKTLSLGLFLHDFIHPDDLPVFTKYFDSVYDKTHQDEPLVFRVKHKNGSWRTFETVASPLFEDHVFAGYVGVARDISQLVEKDRELKEQKEELDRFFKVNLDLFCITDD
jgi:PAS domain S-box-containing protein